ncbi:hypothetical protein LOCC1_G004493, partial [Lachnellula occidentalis]
MASIPSQEPATRDSTQLVDLDAEELKEGLDECLSNIEGDGSFALFEPLINPPNPGIYLKEGGVVGLPLSDRDAEAIIAASRQAPFGKGEDTLVDTSVRKTWEVSPTNFELKNPAWQLFVKTVVARVSTGLGVDATGNGVSAELYKMLLYDEGALFKPHQDSEKAPRMFATLVIALPSKHEGGEVRVTHAGKTRVFETAKFSDFGSSFLAWFSDVTHEVKPVLSGRRLVLTYNLVHQTLGPKELGANPNAAMSKLKLLLPAWIKGLEEDDTFPTTLAFLFEHQYTDASLCYNGLKGHDRQVASHLREACNEFGFCIYLANLEHTVTGGCDGDDYDDDWGYDGGGGDGEIHAITDEIERDTSLKRVVELDGTEVAKDLTFDEGTLIQADALADADPDDEDYSGFTGNEGVSTTHFYHRTVAILIPRSHRIELFLDPDTRPRITYLQSGKEPQKPRVLEWIDRLSAKNIQVTNDQSNREDLKQICKMVIRHTTTWKSKPAPIAAWRAEVAPFSDEVLMRVVTLSLELDDQSLFVGAYGAWTQKSSSSPSATRPGNISPKAFESVGTAFLRYGLESFLPRLSAQCSENIKLADRFELMNAVKLGFETEAQHSGKVYTVYKDWINSETDEALASPQVLIETAADGAILATLAEKVPLQDIFNKILPAVKRKVHHTPMAMAFLTHLFDAGITGKIEEKTTQTIFKDVISDLIDHFSLRSLGDLAASKRRVTGYGWAAPQVTPTPVPDYDNSVNIGTLLSNCLTLQLATELDQILSKMAKEAETAPIELYETLYMPILKFMSTSLRKENFTGQGSSFKQFYQSMLSTYIIRYVQMEPARPTSWARQQTSCDCNDCLQLNRFLIDGHQIIGRFPVGKARRAHLHSQLNGRSGFTHETQRSGNPQTLVVTKTMGAYEASHKAWTERCNVARKHLKSFEETFLKDLLADKYVPIIALYVPIMALSPSKLTSTSRQQQPLSSIVNSSESSSRGPLPPVTKRKVPTKVVVIEDSD